MTTRHLYIFLIFIGHHTFAQTAETIQAFKYSSDTEQKLAMLYDTLKGDWLLKNELTLGKEKNDTLSQKVYNASKSNSSTSRPKIILSFKSGGELVITEFPIGQKIIVTNAKWNVEVRAPHDIGHFYLDIHIIGSTEKVFYEFKGFFTEFEINRFQLTDKNKLESTTQWTVLNFSRL